ncbi:MAG: enterochelin esterase [Alphaproteobacteria bacterium]|nr:enterochelin esterase [Alphaproteobacteria bacterium]
MRRDHATPSGQVHRIWIDSDVLKSNLLGDPTRRIIDVYVPHGHDGRGLPLLVDVVGFTAGGPAHSNWKNFGENLPERLDRLIASGEMPPVVVALPDCFTKLGGNQYINSAAMGRWADFLLQEAVPLVERTYACGGSGKRGLFGKSSGGYGAIAHALLYPDFWSAAACHSGDMAFELAYLPDMPGVLRALKPFNNDIKAWLNDFFGKKKASDKDIHVLMDFAMCATYDPDPSAFMGVRLPVDVETCAIIPERWNNFLAWDPVVMAETRGTGMKKLKALYIDCGDVDQYNLVYGARRLNRLLKRLDVPHIYEEFSDDHSSVDYRMDVSLPILAKALAG